MAKKFRSLLTANACAVLLGLGSSHLAAQEPTPGIVPFPSTMLCGVYNSGERMQTEYGELPFVEGDAQVMSSEPGKAYHGKIRVFLNPNTMSYTIFFDLEDQLSCLLVTGDRLQPMRTGDPL